MSSGMTEVFSRVRGSNPNLRTTLACLSTATPSIIYQVTMGRQALKLGTFGEIFGPR